MSANKQFRRGTIRVQAVDCTLCTRGVTRHVPVFNGYPLVSWGKDTRILATICSYLGRISYPGARITSRYPGNIRVYPSHNWVPGYPGHYLSSSSVLQVCCQIATTNKLLKRVRCCNAYSRGFGTALPQEVISILQ